MGRRVLLFSLLLLLICSQAFAAAPWYEVKTAHFNVLTNSSEKQGREIALRFEQMRAVFGSMWRRAKVNMPVPLQIIAFRSRSEVKQYGPLWKGKAVEVAGFFQGGDDRNFIVIDMSAPDPYETAFHEYAHLLLAGNFPDVPLWFSEGYAEYFRSLKVSGKKLEFGNVPAGIPDTLVNQSWMKLQDLLSVEHNSKAYNEGDKRSIFYAQSWVTVHYLMANQKLEQLAKYLQLTQIEKAPVPEAVQQAFGVDIATLDKTIRKYGFGTLKYYVTDMPPVNPDPVESRKLTDLTAQANLADLHAHSREYQDKAKLEFEAILQQESDNPIANRGLGYIYLRQNDLDRAMQYFRKAGGAESKDARLVYLTALLMNREAMAGSASPAEVIAMRQVVERAIELDPTMADAYNLLSFALSAEGRFDPAITAQMKAIELNPSNEMYQANMVGLYIRAQKYDQAEALLVRLKDSMDPMVRQMCEQNTAYLQSAKEVAAQQARRRETWQDDITAPQWRKKEGSEAVEEHGAVDVKPDTRKIQYLYGNLQSVDCTAEPAAVVSVKSGAKLLRLRTENYKKLMVMGADEFSCDWKNRKVLVNYKPGGKADGDLVTLELQAGK
ncbi:MAG TPA: tetratricopeptide repeat protein [Terriglobales bacterium]|nr:tetratricopeptide repeat protein [Terriglobales bacterium]